MKTLPYNEKREENQGASRDPVRGHGGRILTSSRRGCHRIFAIAGEQHRSVLTLSCREHMPRQCDEVLGDDAGPEGREMSIVFKIGIFPAANDRS
jgi:hypothetical protein